MSKEKKMKSKLLRMVAAMLMFCCASNVEAAGDEKNGHERFIEQLAKARAEFAEKTGNTTRITDAPRTKQQDSSARVYRLDGTPADHSSHDILIQDDQKFVRK